MKARQFLIALFGVLVAAAALAQDRSTGVPPPAPGSQPDICYEQCMNHYMQSNGLVAPKEAAYCDRRACHPSKYAQSCNDTCSAQYNSCGQNAGYANAAGAKCMDQFQQCQATCQQ